MNASLTIRNWLVGAYLVEFEQEGEDRAKYGENSFPNWPNVSKLRESKDWKGPTSNFALSSSKTIRTFVSH